MTDAVEITVIPDHPMAAAFPLDRLAELARFAIAHEPGGGDLRELAVLLTTDDRMRELHRDFMGLDSETDVMTFPASREPGLDGRAGDIVISVDRAAENGRDVDVTPWDEINFLVVHGVLHLCGWDDHDEGDRSRMLARQTDIVREFSAAR